MKTVFIAGATGYLGQFLCTEFTQRGYYVTALVRDRSRATHLAADVLIEAKATDPKSLKGALNGNDLIVSALGVTRQRDGLSYHDVDFQANLNLLEEAVRVGVQRFAYVHVLHADAMRQVPLVAAKAEFADALMDSDIASTIIAPSGFFSDMADFLTMAKAGRAWLFGDGQCKINPIHGADLAIALADAVENGQPWLDVGGPQTFTHRELADLAFECLNKQSRVTHLPDGLRRLSLALLPYVTPSHINGPARFFLTALALDMVGKPTGTHTLKDYFNSIKHLN